jgi:ClpP class serine protease
MKNPFKNLVVMSLAILAFAARGEAFMRSEPGEQYHQLARAYVEGKINADSPIMATLKAGRAQSSPYVIDGDGLVVKQAYTEESAFDLFNTCPANSIAVIPIKGPQSKDDWCGYPGMLTYSDWITKASNSTNVKAIIFYIDCPGSTVAGLFEFADTIKAITHKPKLAYTDGEMCSGGYLIASCTDEIYASSKSPLIGCIGTAISITDYSASDKLRGYKTHYINAEESPDKNKEFTDVKKGDYTTIRRQILGPMCRDFQEHVKIVRGKKLVLVDGNEPISGFVYTAGNAVSNGLIDGIMSFADVVARAHKLSSSSTIKLG